MSKKILLIIFLLLALGISLTLVFRTTIFTNRATFYGNTNPVLKNSYLFASPLQANTKTQEKIRITVFILDNQGLGVANQKVSITPLPNLDIENIQDTTNEVGQAVFNLSSSTPGKYIIQAQLGSSQIPQSISITFF